jgi:acetoin utilization deacetylase AcuC-like enzyme
LFQVFRPALASAEDMTQFHSDEYIEFLRLITPDNQHEHMRQLKRFNCAEVGTPYKLQLSTKLELSLPPVYP